jgi:hypothetical protein
VSSASSRARITLDESVAICSSVAKLTSPPKPHANTVAPSPLTSAAASTAVSVPTIHSEIIAKRHKTTQIDEHSGTFS